MQPTQKVALMLLTGSTTDWLEPIVLDLSNLDVMADLDRDWLDWEPELELA